MPSEGGLLNVWGTSAVTDGGEGVVPEGLGGVGWGRLCGLLPGPAIGFAVVPCLAESSQTTVSRLTGVS
jgi:hypothetical protein